MGYNAAEELYKRVTGQIRGGRKIMKKIYGIDVGGTTVKLGLFS